MNIFKAITRGLAVVSDITTIALSLQVKQKPDFNPLAGDLFAILTEDFKVKPGNATAPKIAAILDDVAALFLV